MRPKTIGFIGDIHSGSLWGLNPKPETAGEKYLAQCYQHLIKGWPKLDLLVLMGDLIDGKQPKAQGTLVHTAHLGTQTDMAIKVLEPVVAKAKRVIRVDGTPYHEDFHGALGKLDVAFGVTKAEQIIDLDLGSGILNVAHHPIGGATLYMGTQVDKETLWSQIAAFEKHVPNARWIVRAHRHTYIKQETRTRTIVQMPCFELPTPHAKKCNYWRFQPSIGGLLMVADERHDSGYQFFPTLYDSPLPEVTPYGSLKARRASTVGD